MNDESFPLDLYNPPLRHIYIYIYIYIYIERERERGFGQD
jgi:hypothetical protein